MSQVRRGARARRSIPVRVAGLVLVLLAAPAVHEAAAQETLREALTFLLTNRSIITDDFERDTAAAAAAGEAVVAVLQRSIGTLPVPTGGSGFVYRLNQEIGTVERASSTFGPFFLDRALTTGADRTTVALTYENASYDELDGRPLRDGTLVTIATRLDGEAAPFDTETVTLRLRTSKATLSVTHGITDYIDLGVGVPIVAISMTGERVDTYRGARALQASASGSASGLGDLVIRAKVRTWQRSRTTVSAGADVRLPTGDEDQLLGAGEPSFEPRGLVSYEGDPVAVHAEGGYAIGGPGEGFEYGAALTAAATPALTIVAEIAGQRFRGAGELATTVEPHPTLAGVETLRLTPLESARNRAVLTVGAKWNVGGTWLLAAHVSRTVTSAGLTAGWMPAVAVDYSFGR